MAACVWSRGTTRSGWSSEPIVTSIASGLRVDVKVSGVPQRGQNVRSPCSEDRNRAGSPATNAKSPRRTLNHATNGAPLVRRQIVQWQFVSSNGASSARYPTNPQKQRPVITRR